MRGRRTLLRRNKDLADRILATKREVKQQESLAKQKIEVQLVTNNDLRIAAYNNLRLTIYKIFATKLKTFTRLDIVFGCTLLAPVGE